MNFNSYIHGKYTTVLNKEVKDDHLQRNIFSPSDQEKERFLLSDSHQRKIKGTKNDPRSEYKEKDYTPTLLE
jgi:hypothetical protein